MSKKFLIKLAGGVALGSAALLLGTPVAALAAPYGQAYGQASERNEVVCANSEQSNEVDIAQIISDNTIKDSDVDVNVEQSASVEATNENETQHNIVVCIGDIDVDVDVEE
ncbi:hypothetical protein [Micromonospora sp. NBC_00858]|uniref:hypothetical protein n=1 Tax=Micromonospora sp. NBC_00858 TaxID=2975979 RepID=UPI003870DC3D|nr:hypothetical protein OG990_30430 [Micromonospora sp. NBC_00858]